MSKPLFHGLLLVNKSAGMTSHDVVARVRRLLGTKSVGHCGTLDPMAAGLMVLLINEATKLSQYILEKDKGYAAEARFGFTSDTLDSTGQILQERPVQFAPEDLHQKLRSLDGDVELPVPNYSAVKINGKKLYEYARSETPIEQPMRTMKFYDIEFQDFDGRQARFRLKCSKGSYIRSFIHELGERLGSGAVMSGLTREWSAPYSLQQAMSLEELEAFLGTGQEFSKSDAFIPMLAALPQFQPVRVKGQDLVLLNNGQISHSLRRQLIGLYQTDQEFEVKALDPDLKLIALLGLEKEKGFVIRRVFRY